jgi:hypothetical protein
MDFLDITISKVNNNIYFDIFRKSTATNTIIPQDSCHPTAHKMTAIRYLRNRNETYILSHDSKQREKEIIDHILQNNKYDTLTISKLTGTTKSGETSIQNTKCAKFTYVGKETGSITKLFRYKHKHSLHHQQ